MISSRFLMLISTTFIFINAHATCADSFDPNLLKSLMKFNVQISTKIQTDYASINRSYHCYFEAFPRSTKEVASLVQFAYQHNIPIRTQGNSHSENGSSLPQSTELLLRTDNLKTIKFDKKGEVTAGAGIPMFLLNNYISENSDFTLPVFNGGGLGPTVGGFISAGGISFTSSQYGGFWNHVNEITIVVANGKILHLKPGDKLFAWMFGSMGQFGVITEAKLAVIHKPNLISENYPLNKTDTISYQHENYFANKHIPLYWFNLFVTLEQLDQARLTLQQFQKRYPLLLNYIQIYEWPLNNNRFVPPLIFPGAKNFYALGVWGSPGSAFDKDKLSSMEKEFDLMVINKHYHRYIQAELTSDPNVYANYFGSEIQNVFREMKVILDPKFLFNRSSVFESK